MKTQFLLSLGISYRTKSGTQPWTNLTEQFNETPVHNPPALNAGRANWLAPINSRITQAAARTFLGGRRACVQISMHLTGESTPPGFDATRSISFKRFPRAFIENGGFEPFYDQIRHLGNAMVEDDPDRTTTSKEVLEWSGGGHRGEAVFPISYNGL